MKTKSSKSPIQVRRDLVDGHNNGVGIDQYSIVGVKEKDGLFGRPIFVEFTR